MVLVAGLGFVLAKNTVIGKDGASETFSQRIKVISSIFNANSLKKKSDFSGQGGAEILGLALVNQNSLVNISPPLVYTGEPSVRNGIVNYVVREGDALSTIAENFAITLDTLLWANNLRTLSIIRPGDNLIILPVSGIKYRVSQNDTLIALAKSYRADLNEIIAFNNLPIDGAIREGDELIIPGGKMPVASRSSQYASVVASRETTAGYFIMPTSGKNWGRLHSYNAVDISNSVGTPIYAAASGKVIVSDTDGWNSGYGKYIMIHHPSGLITLYAHNSQNLVEVGEEVSQGGLIAYMGSTGHSSGPHLHFEVRGGRNPFAK